LAARLLFFVNQFTSGVPMFNRKRRPAKAVRQRAAARLTGGNLHTLAEAACTCLGMTGQLTCVMARCDQ